MLRGFLEGGNMEVTKKTLKILWLTANFLDFEGNGKEFLMDKVIEIIKTGTTIVTQERSGELITDIVEHIRKKAGKTPERLTWLKEEKLLSIYLTLIAKVLRSQETHVSV